MSLSQKDLVLTLKMARLARVVEGQLIPVDAEFNIDANWIKANPSPVPGEYLTCANDLLVLDVEIESEEIYCVDLTFDLRGEEKVERTCFRFDRAVGSGKATLGELLLSI